MALGRFHAAGTISSNANTSIGAAPGLGQRIYVLYATITVETAGTTSRAVLTDGAGGSVLARLATTTADTMLNINYLGTDRREGGRPLTENTALNITTSGGAAATINYDVVYEVRGSQR